MSFHNYIIFVSNRSGIYIWQQGTKTHWMLWASCCLGFFAFLQSKPPKPEMCTPVCRPHPQLLLPSYHHMVPRLVKMVQSILQLASIKAILVFHFTYRSIINCSSKGNRSSSNIIWTLNRFLVRTWLPPLSGLPGYEIGHSEWAVITWLFIMSVLVSF